MQNHKSSLTLSGVLGLFLIGAASAETIATEYPPVKISVYSLHPNSPTYLAPADHIQEQLPIYSGSVSEWIEAVPPLHFSAYAKEAPITEWVPSSPEIKEWILILSGDSEGKPTITALPAAESAFPKGTLAIGNLMHKPISGKYNGLNFLVDTSAVETLKISDSRLSIEAQTLALPYRCEISIQQIDVESRYLFLLAPPHVKGSALMTHRLVKIPLELYETDQPPTN